MDRSCGDAIRALSSVTPPVPQSAGSAESAEPKPAICFRREGATLWGFKCGFPWQASRRSHFCWQDVSKARKALRDHRDHRDRRVRPGRREWVRRVPLDRQVRPALRDRDAKLRDNEGFEIRYNGVPRTFRDRKSVAYEAARLQRAAIRKTSSNCRLLDRHEGDHACGWARRLEGNPVCLGSPRWPDVDPSCDAGRDGALSQANASPRHRRPAARPHHCKSVCRKRISDVTFSATVSRLLVGVRITVPRFKAHFVRLGHRRPVTPLAETFCNNFHRG